MVPEETAQTPDGDPTFDFREVTDARTLRALAHPVRIALLESLTLYGPMTATEVGERIGESPTTCSFHLRQLAKYGFVEEAGGGKGRARPWRMTSIGMRVTSDGEDPESNVAAGAVSQLFRERSLHRYETWCQTRGSYPKEWRSAASDSSLLLFVTAAELEALSDEVVNLVMARYGERLTDHSARPDGAVPVEILMLTYPLELPDRSPGEGSAS